MPTITQDRRALFYTDHQPEAKTLTMLLIHGAGGSHLVWPQVLRHMHEARVVAIDLPGHGRSDLPGRRSITHYAFSIEKLISAAGLADVVLVGHSMGAAIAMMVTLRSAIKPRGLVLMGAGARMPVGEVLLEGSLASPERSALFIAERGFAEGSLENRERVRQQILTTGSTTTFGDFLACNRFDLRLQLGAIKVPALIIAGTNDQLMPLRFTESLVAALPEARLARLPGAGHFVMLEHPEEVTGLITEFLKQLDK